MHSSSFRRNLSHLVAVLVVVGTAWSTLADSADCYLGPGVSAGTTQDLDRFRKPRDFDLPRNPETDRRYRPSDIAGMGIDGENNQVFVWFVGRDSKVC